MGEAILLAFMYSLFLLLSHSNSLLVALFAVLIVNQMWAQAGLHIAIGVAAHELTTMLLAPQGWMC